MSTISIGKVRPTFRGQWQEGKSYEALDWVLYQGQVFQATKEVPADFVPDAQPEFWANIGLRGDKGEKGDVGVRGPAGLDGTSGAPGAMGPQGAMPSHAWSGSGLKFTNADGSWGSQVNLLGPVGPQGAQGLAGAQGIVGPVGPQGPQGPQGAAGPMPNLSNDVTSTSVTIAASAAAVKTAYDAAITAQHGANTAQGTANTANTAAANAQNSANVAYNTAVAAQNTANAANNTATAAYNRPAGAPVPTPSAGIGQWVPMNGTGRSVTLPYGGTWAYMLIFADGTYLRCEYFNGGIAAGGTNFTRAASEQTRGYVGFAWRIA